MVGPFINSVGIIAGGVVGFLLEPLIPRRIEEGLIPTFALIAFSIGVTLIVKIHFVPVVALALIFGVVLGELFSLEKKVNFAANSLQKIAERIFSRRLRNLEISIEDFSLQFSSLAILFCMSGMGILGSLTEGLSGDYQLLLIKAFLDFFTAIIFTMTLGPSVIVLFVPQLTVQAVLYTLAKLIMPFMDQWAYADFSACGGVIMVGLGLRIARIKSFPVVNLLPALLLVIPLSYLWRNFFPV